METTENYVTLAHKLSQDGNYIVVEVTCNNVTINSKVCNNATP